MKRYQVCNSEMVLAIYTTHVHLSCPRIDKNKRGIYDQLGEEGRFLFLGIVVRDAQSADIRSLGLKGGPPPPSSNGGSPLGGGMPGGFSTFNFNTGPGFTSFASGGMPGGMKGGFKPSVSTQFCVIF